MNLANAMSLETRNYDPERAVGRIEFLDLDKLKAMQTKVMTRWGGAMAVRRVVGTSWISLSQVVERAGVERTLASSTLRRMVAAGEVEHRGGKRNYEWRRR